MQSALSAHHFHNEEAAFAYVEAKLWPEGPVCHHCNALGKAGKLKTRPGLWKCYACRKQFTVRMGSVFESSHVPLRYWLQVIYLMCSSKKGVSTRQIQRTLGCGLKTAWFLTHRVREAMKDGEHIFSGPLGGEGKVLEADETYIGRKAENKVNKPPVEKMPVVSLVQRNGRVRSFHVPNVTAANIQPILARHAHPASHLMSDEHLIYKGVGWNFAGHGTVNHSAKEFVRYTPGLKIHSNTVEGYFSILKRGINGIYHHVSEAHLHRYLAEFDFRYSYRVKLGVNDLERADICLKGARGKRLTYERTRRQGAEGTGA
jgi:transposase-like protein